MLAVLLLSSCEIQDIEAQSTLGLLALTSHFYPQEGLDQDSCLFTLNCLLFRKNVWDVPGGTVANKTPHSHEIKL